MKNKSLLIFVGLIALLILSACSVDTRTGSAKVISSGTAVNLTLNGDGRIQVKLAGDATVYFVDKSTLDVLKSTTWVKSDGTEWDLRNILGQQDANGLTGYWVLFPVKDDAGKFDLKVYKDAQMATDAAKAAQTTSAAQ